MTRSMWGIRRRGAQSQRAQRSTEENPTFDGLRACFLAKDARKGVPGSEKRGKSIGLVRAGGEYESKFHPDAKENLRRIILRLQPELGNL
jgi:hypothetical protein